MKNYVQEGEALTIPAPATVLSGAVVTAGALFGIALHDAAAGADCTIQRRGVFSVAKKAETWVLGDKIYYDPATTSFTNVAGALILRGTAVAAYASGATIGNVLLDGMVR